MTGDLIPFALRALMRLGSAGNSALAQYARDKDAIFPDLRQPEPNLAVFVAGFFSDPARAHLVAPGSGPYAEFWTDTGPDLANPRAVDSLYIAIVKIQAEERVDLADAISADGDAAAGLVMIDQWSHAGEPVGPLARVLVTVADIALEYVASTPSITGADGRGEILLSAFAGSLSDSLPDDGNFGPRDRFAERLFAIALRSGLGAISRHADLLVDEEHLRRLVDLSLPPVINALPDDLAGQLDFRRAIDTLAGPALGAAMNAIAENPAAFLGSRFDAATAVGSVTQALLLQAPEAGFVEMFSRKGLEQVYKAALGVAARRPELFVRDDDRDVARQLLVRFSGILQGDLANGGPRLGPEVAAALLATVRDNVHLYVADGDNWESMAADLLENILGGLAAAVTDDRPDALARAFSREQATELVRALLDRIAATPSMIAGDNAEAARLMGLVARTVAADEDLLLTGNDWLTIAAVIFEEAASNPGRLFDSADGAESVAEQLVALMISAASESMRDAGREGGAVLFGATLREAIVILLGATSGRVATVLENIEAIRELVRKLTGFVTEHAANYGSREWLVLFAWLLRKLLGGEPLPTLTTILADSILEGDTV